MDADVFHGCTGLKEVLFTDSFPQMTEYTFNSITATAYYPSNDDTWTSDKLQNYGGTITWVPYGGEHGGDMENPKEYPPEMKWFFEKLEKSDNYLWATGYYAKIMEQYR